VGTDPAVLVTGAGGQVGQALRRELPFARFLPHSELDVMVPSAVHEAVQGVDVIVHLAALTDVDACERDPKTADAVNSLGTRNVAEAAEEAGARVLFVSTNYVFDGTKAEEYAEEDRPAPLNAYGRSKLAGEAEVRGRGRHLIVRTSWVFGGGRNFVKTILEAAKRRGDIDVVDDQVGRPTWHRDLAAALAQLAREDMTGVLHVAGVGEPGSWADLARATLRAAGVTARVRNLDTAAYLQRDGTRAATRPANGVLSLEKARREGVRLGDWRTSLREYVGELS
jgi:dTDP-4-dehydrorhamnose reductase